LRNERRDGGPQALLEVYLRIPPQQPLGFRLPWLSWSSWAWASWSSSTPGFQLRGSNTTSDWIIHKPAPLGDRYTHLENVFTRRCRLGHERLDNCPQPFLQVYLRFPSQQTLGF